MKSINTIFKNKTSLKSFIKKNNLKNKNILLQIFTGILDKNLIQDIINLLQKEIPNVKIIGSSTDGEIIDGKVTKKQIILNFNIFEDTHIKTNIVEKTSDNKNLGKDLASSIITPNTKLIITFADGLHVNGEDFIKGIESVSNVIIAGGLAGDNAEFQETFVFNEKKITSNGAVGASLNSDILKINNEFGFNWEGIGKIMTVTKADGNIVYEIDGKTPVEIYKYYFGEDISKNIVKVGVEFPLILKKGNINIARAVLGQNEDGSLLFAGNINTGDKVQFGYGNIASILKKDETLIKSLQRFDIESIFIYSCMARRRFLNHLIDLELAPFSNITNTSGFFTYGEFFTHNNTNLLLNQTMTILILSENVNKKRINNIKFHIKQDNILTFKALTNLIHTTTYELEKKNLELEYLHYHDSLTQLPNKFFLDKDLNDKYFYEAILIDIKQFSSINDMYGEVIGDKVLTKFAKKLLQISKKHNCKLYRVGNDQFIIINYNDSNKCFQVKTSVFKILNRHPILIKANNTLISINLSIRISFVKGYYKDIKVKADLALNYAKKNNLDFIEYSQDLKLEEKLEKEIQTITMVKKALQEDRVIPVFQKIQKSDGDTYECLVRIKDGDTLISPFFFLDAISQTEYYFKLTKRMIKKSFEIFQNRKETISINFSFKDIENDEIVQFLLEKIDEYNMYSRIIIELLESENINNFEEIKTFISKVQEYGVKIAIDDFGSGYSNFIYLAEIKPDFIKIDGSLIKNIHKDNDLFIITKHINDFAKELGCNTIAEFVHNKEVYEIVKKLNIDGLQGYFIDEPTLNI